MKWRRRRRQDQKLRATFPAICAVDGCASKEEVWAGLGLGARGMRNGSLAHPGGAVMIRTRRGFNAVVELQFIFVSPETSIWVGFPGLTYPM
jgi:hypothetical protein